MLNLLTVLSFRLIAKVPNVLAVLAVPVKLVDVVYAMYMYAKLTKSNQTRCFIATGSAISQ